jgi:hypothetical protein
VDHLERAKAVWAQIRAERGELPAEAPDLPEPRHVDAFKGALLRFWHLMADKADVPEDVAANLVDLIFKLEDEVGEPRASLLRQRWEIEYHRETGRCPRCGETGERHT